MSDTLTGGQKLVKGESLTSSNGAYTLTLQDDGNLVLASRGHAIWASKTDGQDVVRAEVQSDGNFVLYTADKPVWHTDTKGKKNVRLVLQDDRNLVLYGADGPAWSTKTETDAPPPEAEAEAAPAAEETHAEEAAAHPEPEPEPAARTYTVESGDTLWAISERFYGDGSKYQIIADASGISNPDLILPGCGAGRFPDRERERAGPEPNPHRPRAASLRPVIHEVGRHAVSDGWESTVRRPVIRAFVAAVTAGMLAACFFRGGGFRADPVLVFPGMEIHQGGHLCTLGYVDLGLRVAFTAGHCRGDGPVFDKDNNVIGNLATFRDNTPNGAIVGTDQQINDYESIVLVQRCYGEQHPIPADVRWQPDPGLVGDARRTHLPFRRGHRRELRDRRRRQQRLVHDWPRRR